MGVGGAKLIREKGEKRRVDVYLRIEGDGWCDQGGCRQVVNGDNGQK